VIDIKTSALYLALCLSLLAPVSSSAMALMAAPDAQRCAADFAQMSKGALEQATQAPSTAKSRFPGSTATRGSRDVAWAWLASPTARYPHSSMGSPLHPSSLHALSREGQVYSLTLPKQRVLEDLEPRLVDLDGDGLDEIIVIEADSERGAALVSYGLRASSGKMQLQELARASFLGLPFRWLNPVGFADFDGDGKMDIASVTTPHIGGVLTLYRYAPPRIEPYAKVTDVSNHQMGDPNLQMHAVLSLPGTRPTVVVPDMTRRALHALRWETVGGKAQWKELADVKPLPGRVVYLMPSTGASACAQLSDGSWWRIELTQ
jgi:FG-GAP-like repeat